MERERERGMSDREKGKQGENEEKRKT